MEQARIAALLEKYWQAETTVEEERQLAEYFRQPDIPAVWDPWRHVFAYYEAEAQITPGKDFEARLMERIRQTEGAVPASDPSVEPPSGRGAIPLWTRASWWAAAAVIILALGISRLGPAPANKAGLASRAPAGQVATLRDTYDDPQQALAAIRRALRIASVKINHGKTITQRRMDRMNDSWQSALTN